MNLVKSKLADIKHRIIHWTSVHIIGSVILASLFTFPATQEDAAHLRWELRHDWHVSQIETIAFSSWVFGIILTFLAIQFFKNLKLFREGPKRLIAVTVTIISVLLFLACLLSVSRYVNPLSISISYTASVGVFGIVYLIFVIGFWIKNGFEMDKHRSHDERNDHRDEEIP
jgi:amino acid transporter